MAKQKQHPYAGPLWGHTPLTGQMSVGLNGSAVQGPNVAVEFALLSVSTGTSSVSVNKQGNSSVGVGGCPLTVVPQYIPCTNLNQLFLVGSASTTLVNYFAF